MGFLDQFCARLSGGGAGVRPHSCGGGRARLRFPPAYMPDQPGVGAASAHSWGCLPFVCVAQGLCVALCADSAMLQPNHAVAEFANLA